MNKVLLIGGEGYIGNIVAHKLLQDGLIVTSFDNLIYKNHQCVFNKYPDENFSFVYGDMIDSGKLENEIENTDAVVLLAGLVGDPITKNYPQASALINDQGVKNVIDLCAKQNVEKFIFISTCSNYGLIQSDDLADENHELNPLSLYAKSKVNAEEYILSLKDKTEMNPTVLRFATAFGLSPRMRFDLTVNEFTRELLLGNELLVYDAHTWRPYCHVLDFARLIQIVIEAPAEKVLFEVFNAGGEANNATKQMIVDYILEKIPDGKVRHKKHDSDPRNYRVSFDKVKETLGFEPKYTIEDGIAELIDAIKNHVFDRIDENPNFFGNYEIQYSTNS
ncbi:MAG: NAD-dependent epimerase/dehydratase [Candidatus Marinimicrobia bacterium]|nr:NAD-dependent epimerase/dehydratase [Candidatus Neomarinimicrobiota bacterium]|tara:strand:+ start:76107 stop:77111 length:1005 start_codon:yes stop_codon:yes gene_type:complete